MATVFISPSRYIQGAGELKNLGKYAVINVRETKLNAALLEQMQKWYLTILTVSVP